MLWVIILHEYKSLTHKPHSRWDYVMLQYAVIAGLIQFALHLMQILNFAISKSPSLYNRAFSILNDWCDTGGCSSFPNSLPLKKPPIWPKISNFDSSVQRTLFYHSIVQCLFTLALWNLLTLFCFVNRCFLTAILSYRPASQSLLLTVDIDTFFSWYWFSCAVMFGAVSLLSCKLVTLMKLSFA